MADTTTTTKDEQATEPTDVTQTPATETTDAQETTAPADETDPAPTEDAGATEPAPADDTGTTEPAPAEPTPTPTPTPEPIPTSDLPPATETPVVTPLPGETPTTTPPPIVITDPGTVPEPPVSTAPPVEQRQPYDVVKARDPVWGDAAHTCINLFITFYGSQHTLGEIPFTAMPNDVEAHGRAVFERAKNGEWGPVAEPPAKTREQLEREVQNEMNTRTSLANTRITQLTDEIATLQDAVDMEIATPEEEARLPKAKTDLTNWKKYRIYLSRVPTQASYPYTVDWPVQPA